MKSLIPRSPDDNRNFKHVFVCSQCGGKFGGGVDIEGTFWFHKNHLRVVERGEDAFIEDVPTIHTNQCPKCDTLIIGATYDHEGEHKGYAARWWKLIGGPNGTV